MDIVRFWIENQDDACGNKTKNKVYNESRMMHIFHSCSSASIYIMHGITSVLSQSEYSYVSLYRIWF